jgi:hypothetical protein
VTTEDFDELSAEKELEDWRKEQWQRNCHYSEKVRHGIIKLQVDNLRDIINMVVLPLFMNPKDERKKEWYSKVYAKEDSVFTDYISLLNVYDVEIIPDDDLPYLGWYLYSASEGFYRESTGEYEYPLAKHYEEYKQALYDSLDYYEEELSKALFPEKQKDTAPHKARGQNRRTEKERRQKECYRLYDELKRIESKDSEPLRKAKIARTIGVSVKTIKRYLDDRE